MVERPRLTPAMADARRAVRAAFELAGLAAGETVLLAVSGGGDSMALAAAAAFEGPRAGLTVKAAVVDHGLQTGSAEVAAQAAARLRELGIAEVEVLRVEVKNSGDGIEAAAREARYQALDALRLQLSASYLLLGHNLDDQAETVLLGLARGSGLRAISGMPVIEERLRRMRPFLGLTRASLRQACVDQGIEFWQDPHNENREFARVRARQLLALLEQELAPGISEALARTADQVRDAEQLIDSMAAQLEADARAGGTGREVMYAVDALAPAPAAVRRGTLHLIATQVGARNISQPQIAAIDGLLTDWHGQKFVQLSGITVERIGAQLIFRVSKPPTPGAC